MKNIGKKLKEFIISNKWILIIMAILFAERICGLIILGPEYSLQSDDLSYVKSGIAFADTGRITMHGVLSAQIMPGMPVLTGIFSLVFGEGKALWIALKIFWSIMGVTTAFFTYKTIRIFAPEWCGLLCAFGFFIMPNMAWMDSLILTETPFLLLLTVLIYTTFLLARTREKKYFWALVIVYFAALMIKATIIAFPVFALFYLWYDWRDIKDVMKKGMIILLVVISFVIPWSIRNYTIYERFIPVTYGSGNAMMLGTYQGTGYPQDSELDYETNVYKPAQEMFADYYDENGNIEPHLKKYVELETDGLKAKYRMKMWFENDPLSMALSYFVIKPLSMIFSTFYWRIVMGIPRELIELVRVATIILNLLFIILACIRKKFVKEITALAVFYLANIYMFAMSFAYDRYAETLMPMQYIIFGIGLFLVYTEIIERIKKSKEKMINAA